MVMIIQPWNAKLKELYAGAMDKNLTEWVLERFEGVSNNTHICPRDTIRRDSILFFTVLVNISDRV